VPVPYPCSSKDFCAKHWSYEREHLMSSERNGASYHVIKDSIAIEGATITAHMARRQDPEGIKLAEEV